MRKLKALKGKLRYHYRLDCCPGWMLSELIACPISYKLGDLEFWTKTAARTFAKENHWDIYVLERARIRRRVRKGAV